MSKMFPFCVVFSFGILLGILATHFFLRANEIVFGTSSISCSDYLVTRKSLRDANFFAHIFATQNDYLYIYLLDSGGGTIEVKYAKYLNKCSQKEVSSDISRNLKKYLHENLGNVFVDSNS